MTAGMTPEDAVWAKKLKRSVALTPLPSRAGAKVADEFAAAIGKKNASRLSFLLSTPPERLNGKAVTVDVNTGFADAFNRLGSRGQEFSRQKYPALLDAYRTDPLTLAVLKGFDDGAKLLLDKGAEAFMRTGHGTHGYGGALAAAIFQGNKNLMTLLMQQPSVQKELQEKPQFRNWLLHTALGTDDAGTLKHLITLDPELPEKAVVYDGKKAADFTLGTGLRSHIRPPLRKPTSKYG